MGAFLTAVDGGAIHTLTVKTIREDSLEVFSMIPYKGKTNFKIVWELFF
jgi:hypothetical protein